MTSVTAIFLDLGLVPAPSRLGGKKAFYLGRREIAHYHHDRELDLRLTRPVIRALGPELLTDRRIHRRSASSDWVEVTLAEGDEEWVAALVHRALDANRQNHPRAALASRGGSH